LAKRWLSTGVKRSSTGLGFKNGVREMGKQ
jgi:hypothetical protein